MFKYKALAFFGARSELSKLRHSTAQTFLKKVGEESSADREQVSKQRRFEITSEESVNTSPHILLCFCLVI